MDKIFILAFGLVAGSLITFGAFLMTGDLVADIFSEDEKELARILVSQLKISKTDFTCDIDVLSRLHDKPVCLSKLDVITPTELGYILHDYTYNSNMWTDEDQPLGVAKIKGESGRAVEYNGTVNKIKIDGTEYYLITNAVFQGNY